ncbi:MAG: acyl-CoA dehydrogenase family protein [Phycisphaerae bacterium]|nr:acyl-CoA dehydrogenase family protein [Gemmatimonadaceae bacterium]
MTTPSFMRGLFAGEIADELLFPYPAPLDERNAEEAAIVRELTASLNAMIASGLIDSAKFDAEETISDAVIDAMAEANMFAIATPKEFGGLGLSVSAYARVFGAIASVDPSLGVFMGVHCGLCTKAIVLFGNHEQKARYLPALARGETRGAYALTEPETGSDAQHIVSRAERSADGKGWILNGRKHWIGNGHRAGVIVTFAQTPVERDGKIVQRPTAFIIRPDMPGFRVVRTVRKMGIRGSTQAELAYENMFVPDDCVLGEIGKGFRVAVNALNAGRLSLASGCATACKRLLAEMVRYAEARTQFGAPLATFEITQRKLATIASETYAADAMLGSLAAALDEGNVDAALEAACVKVFASEMVWRAADEMVQLAGGRGFVQPWPYERYLRDARINRIFEGANEILRLFVGLNGIEGPAQELKELAAALKNPIRNWLLMSEYARDKVKTAIGATDKFVVNFHLRLDKHRKYIEKHTAELAQMTERLIMRHRKDILHRQLVVERLAEMAMELYARTTTIARTQRLLEQNGEAAHTRELALTDLFCRESGLRFRTARNGLNEPDDATDTLRVAVAAQVRADGGYGSADALVHVELPPLPEFRMMLGD